jgi:hypothetical protein
MEISAYAVESRCGDRAKATRMFANVKKRPDARPRGLWIAIAYRSRGQIDSAFAWLDGVEWNSDLRFNFRTDTAWDKLKNDPRYVRTLSQMGLQ